MGSALGLDANAALTLNATDMFTLSGWTANTSALEGLTNLQDFSFADAQAAVTQLGSLIAASTASTSGLFGQLVPLINQPLGSVTGISQDFANLAADLQPGMNFTLDQLQGALNTAIGQAFGISTTGNYVTVQLSGNLLQLTLNFTPDLAQQSNVPLNFDLPNMGIPSNSNLPGVKDFTGSDMTVTPSASFNLVLDIDMSSPTNPVYDLGAATQFMLGLLIDGPASGTVSLGPLGLTFAGATLALSATASGTTPATFSHRADRHHAAGDPEKRPDQQYLAQQRRSGHRDDHGTGECQPAALGIRRRQRHVGRHADADHSQSQRVHHRLADLGQPRQRAHLQPAEPRQHVLQRRPAGQRHGDHRRPG